MNPSHRLRIHPVRHLDRVSEQEEEAREFTLSKRSGASGRDQSFSAFPPALCPPN
jgi:hypothetical protein